MKWQKARGLSSEHGGLTASKPLLYIRVPYGEGVTLDT